jgi:hypothetical protein
LRQLKTKPGTKAQISPRRKDMAFGNLANRSSGRPVLGPPLAFGAALLAAVTVFAAATTSLPRDAVLPVVSTVFFMMSCAVAIVAWRNRQASRQAHPSYWDVAGALTLFGIVVAAMVEPEQLVRLVEGTHRDH